MKLILHIGLNRTGSSTIQKAMYHNKERLCRRGILVPSTGISYKTRHFQFFNKEGAAFEHLADALLKEVRSKKCHTVILSDESISKLTSFEKFSYFKTFFDDIKVVVFLRRQDLLMESCYNQMIKAPWDPERSCYDLNEAIQYFRGRHWFQYDRLVDRLSAVFNEEDIVATPFEKTNGRLDISRIFFSLCDIDTSGLQFGSWELNKSMPYSAIDFVRSLNAYDYRLCGDNGVVRRTVLKHVSNYFSDRSHLIIPHKRRLEIMNQYGRGNEYVAKRYLKRSDGILFLEPLPDKETAIQEITMPSSGEMIQALYIPIITELKRHVKRAKARQPFVSMLKNRLYGCAGRS